MQKAIQISRAGPFIKQWLLLLMKALVLLFCLIQESRQDLLKLLSSLSRKRRRDLIVTPRTYHTIGTGSQILRDLGVGKMRLLSAPVRFAALSGFGLEVVDHVSPSSKCSRAL